MVALTDMQLAKKENLDKANNYYLYALVESASSG
jgi:hypothetical protein